MADFVVDLGGLVERGRLKDTFRLVITTGQIPSGVLTTGNLRVNR